MKNQILGVLAALSLLAPISATADPITFEWTNNGSDATLFSGSGSWTLDDSFLVAGFNDYLSVITDFQFDWNTIEGSFSVNSATGNLVVANLEFDSDLNLTRFNLCASVGTGCGSSDHPSIQVSDVSWAATFRDGAASRIIAPQTTTSTTVSVPEPGTLALLGLGLIGIGLSRRRRSKF